MLCEIWLLLMYILEWYINVLVYHFIRLSYKSDCARARGWLVISNAT